MKVRDSTMAKCACSCSNSFDDNTKLDCATIQDKKWYKFHVPAELFDEMNNYVGLVKEYLYRDGKVCECDFTREANHIGLKIRMLLRQLEDQINSLGDEFVDLQKVLCDHMQKLDDAMTKVETAIQNAESALATAEEVSEGFEALEQTVNGFEGRITALEQNVDDNTTYSLSQVGDQLTLVGSDGTRSTVTISQTDLNTTYTLTKSGDNITLTGSDGSVSTIQITGGAPEATAEAIEDVLGGMD